MPEPARDPAPDRGALVEQCIGRYPTEGMRAVEELCAQHPALAAALRRRIVILQRAGLIGAAPPQPYPERLGDFRILELLGEGGMGAVFRAEQLALGRQVALKVIRAEHAFSPRSRERFRREIEAIAALRCPGTVQVHTVGEENGTPFYAMELVDGIDLGDLLLELRRAPPERLAAADIRAAVTRVVPRGDRTTDGSDADDLYAGTYVQACCRIALRVARTLAHAHERGVLHRDVKPSNVMIDRLGRVLLLDFGLARVVETEADALTRSGAVVGSLAYMAPEQMRGDREIDARVDVYGLGVTLYELLTHRAAFRGDTQEELRAKVLSGSVPAPGQLNQALPRDAETICVKAMAPERSRRYASALALAEDLQRFLDRRPIQARRAGALYRVRRWAQRHPARATALAAAGVLAIGGPLLMAGQERFARGRIQSALDEAQRYQRSYESTLVAALQGMERTTMRLAEDEQLASGKLDALRRELLEGAAEFWQQMAAREAEAHPRVREALFRSRLVLGSVRRELGDVAGARGVLAEAVADLERARAAADAAARPRLDQELAQTLFDQGELLVMQRQWPAAVDAWTRSAAIAQEGAATAANPAAARRHVLRCRLHIAQTRAQSGDGAAAVVGCREVVAELERLQPAERDLLLRARTLFAAVLMHAGAYDEALPALQAALALRGEREREDPTDAGNLRDLKSVHHNLGHLYQLRNDIPAARQHLELAAAIARRLVTAFPDRLEGRLSLVSSLMVLGNVCLRMADREAAVTACREAVARAEDLARTHPDVPDAVSGAAEARSTLAQILMEDAAQRAEAIALLRSAVADLEPLARAPAASAQALAHLGTTHALLASALSLVEDRAGSLAAEEEALAALLAASERDPSSPIIQGNAARAIAAGLARSLRAGDEARIRSLLQRAAAAPAVDTEVGRLLEGIPAEQHKELQRLRGTKDG